MAGTLGEFLAGVGLLGRGLGLIARRRRLLVTGALPPLLTSVVFTAVLIVLLTELDRLVGWLTPFADGWSSGSATVVRALIGLALVAGAALLMVITFSALTLALGGPIYDKISEFVDEELGAPARPVDEPVLRSLGRGLRQSLTLVAVSVLVGLVLLLAGFVPVVGQTLVPVVSAIFGGWMLSIELVGSAFERRGLLRLSDRRSALRSRRARVLGFSVPTFLLLAVPFAAVVVFPVATAAGTILARDLLRSADSRLSEVGPPRPA
jgi:CysZ protein